MIHRIYGLDPAQLHPEIIFEKRYSPRRLGRTRTHLLDTFDVVSLPRYARNKGERH